MFSIIFPVPVVTQNSSFLIKALIFSYSAVLWIYKVIITDRNTEIAITQKASSIFKAFSMLKLVGRVDLWSSISTIPHLMMIGPYRCII